ncbi:hypothetical protein N431DRAFT_29819 [Stipitochalara longipes BDJ]|nr:hypothetical protein N431DRAFT_29819 [Stipitochalara longipes BDJ]
MTPTPPSNSSFSPFRFRRPRNTIPYDASNNATPPSQIPVTPLVDEGADQEIEDEDPDDEDEEGADEDDGSGIDEDGNDGEDEEEGGIEDGLFAYLLHLLACIFMSPEWPTSLMPASIWSLLPSGASASSAASLNSASAPIMKPLLAALWS